MARLTQQIAALPKQPGVYLYKDQQSNILYVGKAKNLRSRVRSYFRPNADLDEAKKQLVHKIASLETIVTDNENEALILEANLIRRYQPAYNVVLTDDKFYLFIKITVQEEFPRVFPVRKIKSDQARYFGPYSSATSVRQTLKLLRSIFPHRLEKSSPHDIIFPHPLFTLPTPNTLPHLPSTIVRHQAWLKSHYQQNIQNIIRFLQGERATIIKILTLGMQQAAEQKDFERAAIFRDQLQAIERLEGNQKVYLRRRESFDVVSLATQHNHSAANVFSIRHGKLINKNTFLLRHRQKTPSTEILRQFLLQYYQDAQNVASSILIPEALPDSNLFTHFTTATLTVPHRGLKKQLLEMGRLNAQQLLHSEQKAWQQDTKTKQALQELAQVLNLTSSTNPSNYPLQRIETYDISNTQGRQATGSMVVFINGQPDKSQYRKFRIKTKHTPDDFAMLQEIISRRLQRLKQDQPNTHSPDLILIDGGKGQLSAVYQILSQFNFNIPLASIAKREETLFTYTPIRQIATQKNSAQRQHLRRRALAINLPYDSDALYLVQRMRDEAHRFGITYHRLLRSKQSQRSILDEIPGLGPKTKHKLINHFGSLKAIRAASETELHSVIGPAKTQLLKDYL